MKNDPLSSPSPVALPHFWWKGSSPRAVIPLEVNAFLGKPAACCHFAIGAARKIERRGTPKTLCFIGGFELHQKCGRAKVLEQVYRDYGITSGREEANFVAWGPDYRLDRASPGLHPATGAARHRACVCATCAHPGPDRPHPKLLSLSSSSPSCGSCPL